MRWNLSRAGECYRAVKDDGLSAFAYRVTLWQEFARSGSGASYDLRFRGRSVARITFENKGAAVTPLPALRASPELSDLDLVEIALWISKLRAGAAAAN